MRTGNTPAVAPRRAASTPAPTFDTRSFSRFLQDQGRTNSCGTTSLAMLLSFWKGRPGAYTHQTIDRQIRGFDLPTSPLNVVPYLRQQGFRAEAYNHASVDSLRRFLDQGVPVQVLYDPTGNGNDQFLHYVNVVGYQADAAGKPKSFTIADPAGGKLTTVSAATFTRRWDRLEVGGVGTGLNNVMIVALPKTGAVVGPDGKSRSVSDIRLPRGGRFGEVPHLIDAAADLGNLASQVTSAVTSWSARRLQRVRSR